MFLIEPNSGMRLMQKTLKDKDASGQEWDASRGGYISRDKDPVAVTAENDLVAGRTEIRTISVMVGTEDLPMLLVQIAFLLALEIEALDLAFWLTTAGTILHLVQKGSEAGVTHRNLDRLASVANGRDKAFSATPQTRMCWRLRSNTGL